MAWKRFALLLCVVLASGLIAAGCGDDDENGGDQTAPVEVTLPTVDTEGAQEQATEAVETAKEKAYEACKDAAEELPETQRDEAFDACESLK